MSAGSLSAALCSAIRPSALQRAPNRRPTVPGGQRQYNLYTRSKLACDAYYCCTCAVASRIRYYIALILHRSLNLLQSAHDYRTAEPRVQLYTVHTTQLYTHDRTYMQLYTTTALCSDMLSKCRAQSSPSPPTLWRVHRSKPLEQPLRYAGTVLPTKLRA